MLLMTLKAMIPLRDAETATSGAKAANLGLLLRAGLPVPEGFVIPVGDEPSVRTSASERARLRRAMEFVLRELGGGPVAVRSSGVEEDTSAASAAGQYETFLAVEGVDDVLDAIEQCHRSALAPRVAQYRARIELGEAESERLLQPQRLAVLVQKHVDAEVSGVLFTPSAERQSARIEATWGLGTSLVGGSVTPDSFEVPEDGDVTCVIGSKAQRADRCRARGGIVISSVPEFKRSAVALDGKMIGLIVELGGKSSELLGAPQDIEWAIAEGKPWLLQSRPITADLPGHSASISSAAETWVAGMPAARGSATGVARVVRGPDEFGRVRPGDIIICPWTDPSWTPLFAIAGGVVTETGGALCHAAIVAREYGIPAVTGLPDATRLIPDGVRVTLDGTAGTLGPG
ncbi:Phosphoenolpyruvate synthase [Corynebacterium hansenii]|nr:Phosphoenolpyruvate synthase [Corynebacterium hansenii]